MIAIMRLIPDPFSFLILIEGRDGFKLLLQIKGYLFGIFAVARNEDAREAELAKFHSS